MSRVFVKTSLAFGRRRFHQKNTDNIVCPAPSVFLLCFISVCLGFPLCVVFFCSSLLGNFSWLSFCTPISMVLDIVEGQGRGRGTQNGQNSSWGKNIERIREAKNSQNSIWCKPDIFKYADTKRATMGTGEGRKSAIFSAPTLRGPTGGPTVRGTTLWVPQLRPSLFLGLAPTLPGPHPSGAPPFGAPP